MSPSRILIIRADNIGDLVCTTPLLEGLRRRFPEARITVLANTYNRPVLDRNPHVDEVVTYTKQAHRNSIPAVIAGALSKVLTLLKLRLARFDLAIAATTPLRPRLAKMIALIAPARLLAERDSSNSPKSHEAERVWNLGREIGLEGSAPAARIYPDPEHVQRLRREFEVRTGASRLIAVHISSRKPSQQWPADHFSKLLRELHQRDASRGFVIFWAPGAADDSRHSGDDEKAAEILALEGLPLIGHPTPELTDTIHALAACDVFIGSDGGAMHLAAAAGLPVVCFFGDSSASQWRPWKTPHRLLQMPTRDVRNITPAMAAEALEDLEAEISAVAK